MRARQACGSIGIKSVGSACDEADSYCEQYPFVGLRADQRDSAISKLMEIIFWNMATVAVPAKFRVTVRRDINGTRRVLGVVSIQCDCSFPER